MADWVVRCRRRPASVATVSALGLAATIVLLAYASYGTGSSAAQTSSLLLVSAVFRHGDRSPTWLYPTDPYNSMEYWPDGLGALSNKGKMQMYILGQILRSRYGTFLNQYYLQNEVYIQSSAHDRCLTSALAFLAGLYPPKDFQIWNPKLLWQPIPVHSVPRKLDNLIVMKKPCKKYEMEYKRAYNSEEMEKFNEENSDLYKYLSHHTNYTVNNISIVETIFNTLEIEEGNGLKLPEWTKSVYPEKMAKFPGISLAIGSKTTTMKRLNGGSLVKQMIQHMSDKRDGKLQPDRKIFFYSAHDVTIINVLQTLGFTELLKPEYGAVVLLELHKSPLTDYEVKVMYMKNSESKNPDILKVPGCNSPCSLDEFVSVLKPVLPGDWEKECEMQDFE